jgi:hypothetical protein
MCRRHAPLMASLRSPRCQERRAVAAVDRAEELGEHRGNLAAAGGERGDRGRPIRNQLLAGFMRDYISPVTARSYMESRGEGFLALVRESERVSGRRPELDVIGRAVRLTIFAAQES